MVLGRTHTSLIRRLPARWRTALQLRHCCFLGPYCGRSLSYGLQNESNIFIPSWMIVVTVSIDQSILNKTQVIQGLVSGVLGYGSGTIQYRLYPPTH